MSVLNCADGVAKKKLKRLSKPYFRRQEFFVPVHY